jgi:hypothetical protein
MNKDIEDYTEEELKKELLTLDCHGLTNYSPVNMVGDWKKVDSNKVFINNIL